jgi:hypothetical protein
LPEKPEAYKILNISRSENFTEWMDFRRTSLSSTDATRLLSKKFDVDYFVSMKNKSAENNYVNKYMEFGNKREPEILEAISKKFDVTTNDNIMQSKINESFVATPDGINKDYTVEVKSSINNLNHNIKKYYPQIQWQMFVTGKKQSLFIVEIHQNFIPQQIEYTWVPYDEFLTKIFIERGEKVLESLKLYSKTLIHTSKPSNIFSETSTKDTDFNVTNTPDDIEW